MPTDKEQLVDCINLTVNLGMLLTQTGANLHAKPGNIAGQQPTQKHLLPAPRSECYVVM